MGGCTGRLGGCLVRMFPLLARKEHPRHEGSEFGGGGWGKLGGGTPTEVTASAPTNCLMMSHQGNGQDCGITLCPDAQLFPIFFHPVQPSGKGFFSYQSPPPALGGFGSGKGRHRSGQSGCALWEVMVEAREDFWGLDLLGRLNFCSSNTGCCSNASSPIVWLCSLLSLPTLKIIKNRENCNIFRVF